MTREADVAEMRAESRDERTLYAMTCILDGEACLDRLSQMNDWDDFEGETARLIDAAVDAEAEGEDMAVIRAHAEAFITAEINEYMEGGR